MLDLAQQIIDADFHKEGLKTLLIGKEENFNSIQEECLSLYKNFKSSDVTLPSHRTYWTNPYGKANQWDLFNADGKFDSNDGIGIKYLKNKKFHHHDKFPNLGKFIDSFPDKINFRLNLLKPGSGLGQHEEQIVETYQKKPFIRIRFHLPIQTNEFSNVFLDGEWFHYSEGNVYFFNNGCIHCAENNGDEDRLHLVWDCVFTKRIEKILSRGSNISNIRVEGIDPNYARMKRFVPDIDSTKVWIPDFI